MNNDLVVVDPVSTYVSGQLKARPAWAVSVVDSLINKVNQKSVWETVEFLIKVWEKKNPELSKRFYLAKNEVTKSRSNKTGSSKSKTMRYLLELPEDLMVAMDILISQKIKEEPNFWRKFAQRYPGFKVPEKV